jgi:hypothetical protein
MLSSLYCLLCLQATPLNSSKENIMNQKKSIDLQQTPPNNPDAEFGLLSCLMNKSCIEQAQSYIGEGLPDLFYIKQNQDICTAILNLYENDQAIVFVTIMKVLNNINQNITADNIQLLIDYPSLPDHLISYLQIVKDEAYKRALIKKSYTLYQSLFDKDIEVEFLAEQSTQEMKTLNDFYAVKNNKKFGWNADEIVSMDITDPLWIVKDYIPEGLTLIAGAPKIGKSWMTLSLAIAVASNGRFLGSLPVDIGGDVLYLALEDSVRRIKSRLSILNPTQISLKKLTFWTDIPKINKGGLARLDHWIKAQKEPRLIVIDVLEKVRDRSATKFSNAYAEDYEELGRIKKLADDSNISIVVVHHKNKAVTEDIMDSISGSVGAQGVPDGILIIRKPRKESIGTLFRTGKDYDDDREMAIKFDLSNGVGWELMGEAEEFQLTDQREKIVDCLDLAEEALSPKQIADNCDMDPNYIRTTIRRMLSDGLIKQFGRGKYTVNQLSDQYGKKKKSL